MSGAVVAIVVLAVAAADLSPGNGANPETPEALTVGADLYLANCAACHGSDLRGTDTGPPFLDVIYAPNHHGDEAFQLAAANGVVPHHWSFGTMPPVGTVNREEVAQIVEYVRFEQQAAGILRDPSHP